MKQLGNLVIVCANRDDVLMQLYNGMVSVYVGIGPERTCLSAEWNDDKRIGDIVYELNHGTYAMKNTPSMSAKSTHVDKDIQRLSA